jgi:DNA-binding MarR family transcriptional regulator
LAIVGGGTAAALGLALAANIECNHIILLHINIRQFSLTAMDKHVYDRNFGFLIHDIARFMRTSFDQLVKDTGLTRSQWWVLVHLLRYDGMTQAEVADELDIGRATLGTLLDNLEKKGWVRREVSGSDRRAKRVFHTEKVQPVLDFMNDAAALLHRQVLAGLSKQEQKQMVEHLVQIRSNLLVLNTDSADLEFPFAHGISGDAKRVRRKAIRKVSNA